MSPSNEPPTDPRQRHRINLGVFVRSLARGMRPVEALIEAGSLTKGRAGGERYAYVLMVKPKVAAMLAKERARVLEQEKSAIDAGCARAMQMLVDAVDGKIEPTKAQLQAASMLLRAGGRNIDKTIHEVVQHKPLARVSHLDGRIIAPALPEPKPPIDAKLVRPSESVPKDDTKGA